MNLSVLDQLTPEQVVALTIWGEARGGSPLLRQGIGSVIQNRVQAHREAWGLTPQDVCLAPKQFSCWITAGGAHNYERVMEAVMQVVNPAGIIGPILRECLHLGWQVTGNQLPDVTGGAVNYYAPKAMKPVGRVPEWADGRTPTVIIDGTAFYAETERRAA